MPLSPFTPQRCRAHADECRRYANSSIDPKVRARWLVMARAWERSATEFAAQEILEESIVELEVNADPDNPTRST